MRYALVVVMLLVLCGSVHAVDKTIAVSLTDDEVSTLTSAMNAENARLTAEAVKARKIANLYTLDTWISEIVTNTIKASVKAQKAKEYDAAIGKLKALPRTLTTEDKATLGID